jgi:hypothetical protein
MAKVWFQPEVPSSKRIKVKLMICMDLAVYAIPDSFMHSLFGAIVVVSMIWSIKV